MHTCTHAQTRTHARTHTTYTRAHTHVRTHTHVHTRAQTHTHTHTYTHTYIHTHLSDFAACSIDVCPHVRCQTSLQYLNNLSHNFHLSEFPKCQLCSYNFPVCIFVVGRNVRPPINSLSITHKSTIQITDHRHYSISYNVIYRESRQALQKL